ncbi:MAG: hypothetical protein GY869_06650, partial [Planctomycetes bacterium]|nr:hypothetical protein [Planctomycetota bacterium]
IEPGVDIIFDDHYRILVEGNIQAIGTEQDSITFAPADTSIGFASIQMINADADTNRFAYCHFIYGVSDSSGGAMYANNSPLVVEHSLFEHCRAVGGQLGVITTEGGGAIYCSKSRAVLLNNYFYGNSAPTASGGAIAWNGDTTSIGTIISNNIFRINLAENGGAIWVASANSEEDVVVSENDIQFNTSTHNFTGNFILSYGGGGIFAYSMTNSLKFVIINNTISNNVALSSCGGGINAFFSDVKIESNVINNNQAHYGGGISIWQGEITLNIIRDNTANYGGGICQPMTNSAWPSLVIRNVLVANNTNYGLFIYNNVAQDIIVESCTFFNNVLYGDGGNGFMNNSIVWHTSNQDMLLGNTWNFRGTVTYSNIRTAADTVFVGLGNINTDPFFVDHENGDFHLSDSSLCIGAGTPDGAPDIDMEGNPRPNPVGSNPDMGAYENELGNPVVNEYHYIAYTDTDDIYVAKVNNDTGIAFENTIVSNPGGGDPPGVNIDFDPDLYVQFQPDGNDNLKAIWSRQDNPADFADFYFSDSNDGGLTWTDPALLFSTRDENAHDFAFRFNPDGSRGLFTRQENDLYGLYYVDLADLSQMQLDLGDLNSANLFNPSFLPSSDSEALLVSVYDPEGAGQRWVFNISDPNNPDGPYPFFSNNQGSDVDADTDAIIVGGTFNDGNTLLAYIGYGGDLQDGIYSFSQVEIVACDISGSAVQPRIFQPGWFHFLDQDEGSLHETPTEVLDCRQVQDIDLDGSGVNFNGGIWSMSLLIEGILDVSQNYLAATGSQTWTIVIQNDGAQFLENVTFSFGGTGGWLQLVNADPIATLYPDEHYPFEIQVDSIGLSPGIYSETILVQSGLERELQIEEIVVELLIPSGFACQLIVTDSNDRENQHIFGTDLNATDGYDPGLDRYAPPLPPIGTFASQLEFIGETYMRDFRAPIAADPITWTIYFRPSAEGNPITLSWDSDCLPEGNFVLQDTSGVTIVSNMKNVNSYQVAVSTLSRLQIVYSLPDDFNPVVEADWNMVALPLAVADNSEEAVFSFPPALSNTLYKFDGSYVQVHELNIGLGYWLRFEEEAVVTISGSPVLSDTLELNEGWNLIGGPSCDVPLSAIDDPGNIIIDDTLYGFDGSYYAATVIEQGNGYWIRTNNYGLVILSCDIAAPSNLQPVAHRDDQDLAKLTIVDAAGQEQTLYFAANGTIANQQSFGLPPVPPAGSFDIRFSGDTRLAAGEKESIQIRGADYPLVVTADNIPNHDHTRYEIQELSGSEVGTTYPLSNGTSIVIENPGTAELQLSREAVIPLAFSVRQNYPNPF